MKKTMTKLMLAFSAMIVTGAALAAPINGTTTMAVTASINDECAVGNTAALAFGALAMLTPAGQPSTSPSASVSGGTFDAICTFGTNPPTLKFDSANTVAGAFLLKGVVDATATIVYTLTNNNGNAAVSHGTAAAFTGFSSDGTTKSLKINGSIAAAAKAGKPGQTYTDTITITAAFTP